MIGWIRLVAALVCVILGTILLVPIQLIAMLTGWYDEGLTRRLWHRMNVKALGFRIHVRGEIASQRPLLIAANHISWTDIGILASIVDMSFIAKSDIDDWPVIGKLFRLQRPIYVERGRRSNSGEQIDEIARRLAGGLPIVLFPEGTTGDGNGLLPFKSSLFGAAAAAISSGFARTTHIQPVAVIYTRANGLPIGRRDRLAVSWIGDAALVAHLSALLRGGAIDVEVHFGDPLEFTPDTNRKEVARLMESRVRAMMQSARRDMRPGV